MQVERSESKSCLWRQSYRSSNKGSPMHRTFKTPSSPDPLPGAGLPTWVTSTRPSAQAPGGPAGYFHGHSNSSSTNGSFSPQSRRQVIKAPSFHLPSLGLGTGFESLPWMWPRNPQGDFSGHLPFTLFTAQLDARHTLCWAEPGPPRITSGRPRVPCLGKREKRVQSIGCVLINTALVNISTILITSCKTLDKLLNPFEPEFTYQQKGYLKLSSIPLTRISLQHPQISRTFDPTRIHRYTISFFCLLDNFPAA